MIVIAAGDKNICKLFPPSIPNDKAVYRCSHYVLRCALTEGTLLCNSLTGEMVLLSTEETKLMESLPLKGSAELARMIQHRFIVPEDSKEVQTVEQIRSLLLKRREASHIITHYQILPTTFCNARCFYCYENGIHQVDMNEETANIIIRFISDHHGDNEVKLSWFGGEPMLGKKRIDQICRGLDDLNIRYQSGMTSNGYLFNNKMIRHAKEVWNLRSIQITLDGTEEIYNRTKSYQGVTDNPYQRVLHNIDLFVETEIQVQIRLNMGDHNVKDLKKLVNDLSKRYKSGAYLSVYVRKLTHRKDHLPCQNILTEQGSKDYYLAEMQDMLEKFGWPQYGETGLPKLLIASCMANDPASIQFTPDGILSKCEDQIYQHTVGSLELGITNQQELQWWQQRKALGECENCPVYPTCRHIFINCPVNEIKCTDHEKTYQIARYEEIMKNKYTEWKRRQSGEDIQSISNQISSEAN